MKESPHKNGEYNQEVLIIKSQVKKYLNDKEMWIKAETFRDINDKVIKVLDDCIQRAKLDRRRTIAPKHI